MMFSYERIEEDLFSKELGTFSSFGISVYLIVDEKHLIGVASDVSDDINLVDRIVGYCNKKQINPLQLLNTVGLFI